MRGEEWNVPYTHCDEADIPVTSTIDTLSNKSPTIDIIQLAEKVSHSLADGKADVIAPVSPEQGVVRIK